MLLALFTLVLLGVSVQAQPRPTGTTEAAPSPEGSARQLARAELLDRVGLLYEARHASRKDDLSLLRRVAEVEDTYGVSAVEAYRRYAEALAKTGAPSRELLPVLERGLMVSLRDDDTEAAGWFVSRLESAGSGDAGAWLGASRPDSTKAALVPGGTRSLAFVARGKEQVTPDRFFVAYARSLVDHTATGSRVAADNYRESILKYFKTVTALDALGKRVDNRVTVTVSLADDSVRLHAERVLNLLGWRLRFLGKRCSLEAGETSSQAERQEISSALAVDEVGMKEALEAGEAFQFEIVTELAPVLLGEDAWRAALYPGVKYAGGFAEAMARDSAIARAYIGLSALDHQTLPVLVDGLGLKDLVKERSFLLLRYSSALTVARQHAVVPGGEKAEPAWTRLLRVSPDKPAAFFRALLEKDDGKLLAFFYALSQLDSKRQRFFVETPSRLEKFYDLFSRAPEMEGGAARLLREASFVEFLQDIPLDSDGRVRFPGSAEVWMVAKGQSGSAADTNRRLRKIAKRVAPEAEDKILIHLAKTRYGVGNTMCSELDNFLAVARIDEHRDDPLDEAAALLLAQNFVNFGGAYPYFSALTGLTEREFRAFFGLGEKLRLMSNLDANVVLGQLDPLIHLLSLGQQSGALSRKLAADLFHDLCERFARAGSTAEYAVAALDSLRLILGQVVPDLRRDNPDDAVRALLLGGMSPVDFELADRRYIVPVGEKRESEYRRVLDLQKVASLNTLFRIRDAAGRLAANPAEALAQVKTLELETPSLPTVEIPRDVNLDGQEREHLRNFRPDKVAEIIGKLRQKTLKQKVNSKDLRGLAHDLIEEIAPQVSAALTGIIYAYYLYPDDLPVSEDPLLVRKHQFRALQGTFKTLQVFPPSRIEVRSEKAGGFFGGSLASFSAAAGKAATAGRKLGDDNSESVVATQLGSIRGTDWRNLRDGDVRLFGLTVLTGREWIVEAARQPQLLQDLAEQTLGLLSLARRADLLAGLAVRDWRRVWASVSLSDLYWLGSVYRTRHQADSWQSPVTVALKNASVGNDGSRLRALGAYLPVTSGCSHPHLRRAAPYEEFERRMFPSELGERVAELKLYLALQIDRAGIPAAALPVVAERVARAVFRHLRMTDMRDWHSVLAAFSRVDGLSILEALGKE